MISHLRKEGKKRLNRYDRLNKTNQRCIVLINKSFCLLKYLWATVTTKNTRILIDSNKTELFHSLCIGSNDRQTFDWMN